MVAGSKSDTIAMMSELSGSSGPARLGNRNQSGGTSAPPANRLRRGTAAPSTLATMAVYPASRARSASARVRPRSRNMYICAQRGASGAAAATSSSDVVAAIDTT